MENTFYGAGLDYTPVQPSVISDYIVCTLDAWHCN